MKSIRPNGLIRNRLAIAAAMVVGASAPAIAADHYCTTAAQFTTALTNASLSTNDTITLDAASTFTAPSGGFVLPNKSGTGWITIRSSALASLPAAGTRVNLTHASNMPKIKPLDFASSAIKAATSAHHFKLVGLEVIGVQSGTNKSTSDLVALGTSGTAQDTLAEAPHDLVIDRCIIRAASDTHQIKRGVGLNSASTDITNSYISGFKISDQDTQAIGGYNGPGPFNIINNFLEAAGENILFGGATPTIPNLVPADMVIKQNHFFKPLTWNQNHASYSGNNWSIKNIFELKNGARILVEGNILENNWVDSQAGWCIPLTPANDGLAPWTVVEDVTFRNNVIRGIGGGPNMIGYDQGGDPSEQTKRIIFENNLWYDIGGSLWGNGKWAQVGIQMGALTFDHNTVFQPSNFVTVSGGPHTGFVFKNNIVNREGGFGEGEATITGNFPGAVFTANVIKGGIASRYDDYPGNKFPTDWSFLVDKVGGDWQNGDWDIAAGHAYNNAGTDGKDLGADIPAIITATAGCITGVWANPPTTITLKNGVNGYTGATSFHVRGQTPTTHHGSAAWYHESNNLSGTSGFVLRPFYKFDVSQAASGIPSGSTINSATFRVKVEMRSVTQDNGISIYRVAPVNGAFTVNYATATRNTYNGTNSWTGGANAAGNVADSNNDYLDTPVDNNSTIPAVGTWMDFDVTSAVQAWVSGTANNGLLIIPNPSSSTATLRLSTPADNHGSAEYPTLEVTYQ